MLKLHQMEVLVGAAIGMLEENLSEEKDPNVREQIENYKKQLEEMYGQIMFAKFLEEIGAKDMMVHEES